MPRRKLIADADILTSYAIAPNGCWEFTGHINAGGYGVLTIDRASAYAHRVYYEAFVGPIPTGLTIDHLCRNRCCVNPEHLEPVTIRVNVLRSNNPFALNARKTHCKWGHQFSAENTVRDQRGRTCLKCRRARINRYDAIRRHGIDRPVEFYLAKAASR